MLIGDVTPRSLRVGEEARVTVRVRSPVGRLITRIVIDVLNDGQEPTGVFGTDLMAVNRFSFWPTSVGRREVAVEAEDDAGCVTRVQFGPEIDVLMAEGR